MKLPIKILMIIVALIFEETKAIGQQEMWFKNVRLDEPPDYIKLTKLNDSLFSGVYFGVATGGEGERFFYKSGFIAGRMAGNDLVFFIDHYFFTDSLYNKIRVINKKQKGFPVMLTGPIRFICSFDGVDICASRITNQHLFSAADNMKFMRINR